MNIQIKQEEKYNLTFESLETGDVFKFTRQNDLFIKTKQWINHIWVHSAVYLTGGLAGQGFQPSAITFPVVLYTQVSPAVFEEVTKCK